MPLPVQGAAQAAHAFARAAQRLRLRSRVGRHPRDLQVGVDHGQRRAQFVRSGIGEGALLPERPGQPFEQPVERGRHRSQLGRGPAAVHRLGGIGIARLQRPAQRIERRQAAGNPDPQRRQAAQQGDEERHAGGQQDVPHQGGALVGTVRGGDVVITEAQGIGAPGLAVDPAVGKARRRHVQRRQRRTAGRRDDLAAQGADLAGDALAPAHRDRLQQKVGVGRHQRCLLHQARHHARGHRQPLVEGAVQAAMHVLEHPGRGQGPQQRGGDAGDQHGAQAQAHSGLQPRR